MNLIQTYVIGAVAATTGLKKEDLKIETLRFMQEEYEGLMHFESAIPRIGRLYFYCTPKTVKRLFDLTNKFSKVEQSEVYADLAVADGFGVRNGTTLLVFHVKGSLLCMYEADYYSGLGGMFFRDKEKKTGVVIEPLANYLKNILVPREE